MTINGTLYLLRSLREGWKRYPARPRHEAAEYKRTAWPPLALARGEGTVARPEKKYCEALYLKPRVAL